MEKLQNSLDSLIQKYNVGKTVKLLNETTMDIEGKTVTLLPWRNERRFRELRNLVTDGTLEGISVMRVCHIGKDGTDLNSMIYRELDLCEWILGSEVSEIYTIAHDNKTSNIIVKLKSGIICTLEIAATLCIDTYIIDKHEIISRRGVACDRVVDTQVPQQSIYVFTDKKYPDTYLDTDFELFGLTADEIAIVRQAFEISKNDDLAYQFNSSAKHLEILINLSDKSVKSSNNVTV